MTPQPRERFLGRLRSEGAKLLPESQIEKYRKPKHTFQDLAHCKSLMRQPHRKGSIIIPLAGQHPYAALVGQWTSTPQWDMLSGELRPIMAGLPEPIRLTFTRLYALWAKLDECLNTSRFGLGSIEFVRTARSAYFAVHCLAERAAHAIGWIRVWTKDPATDERFMDDVRLAWIDGPTRQPLVLF